METNINEEKAMKLAQENYTSEIKTLSMLLGLAEGSSYLKEKAQTEYAEYLEETTRELLFDLGYSDDDTDTLKEVTRILDNEVEEYLSEFIHLII